MRTSRWVRLLAVLFAFALIAAACGDDDDGAANTDATDGAEEPTEAPVETPDEGEAAPTEAPAETPDEGGEEPPEVTNMGGPCDATQAGTQVNYGVFFSNRAFDPTVSSGALVGGTELAAVYDVLFIFDPVTAEIKPHLAESLTPNDDFTQWTLKLREGIAFSDGTPLTAQLVSDNIDRYFREEGVRNTSGGFLQYIETRNVVDDVTLEMNLNTAFAEFGLVFADEPGMIVNTNVIGDDLDAFGVLPPDAAGLGPYTVETNLPGEETILKARSDYWGGPVCIETLRFVWIPGSQATFDAFQNGELDVAFLRDPVVNAAAADAGAEGFFFDQDGGAMLNFNHREGRATADPRVREAIMLALDPSILNDRAYQGALETTKAYFGPNSRFYSDAIEELPVDTVRAAELVEEAKADGWDGKLAFVGTSTPPGPDIVLAVEGMLQAIGIEVESEQLGTGDQIAKLGAGDFDLITNGWNSGPGTGLLSLVRNLSSTSPTNRIGYESPEMDGLLNDALAASPDALPAVMAQINNLINTDFVSITYGITAEGAIWQDGIVGITPTVSSIFLFHAAAMDG